MSSLVPENTPWGDAFNKMASEWSKATNGEVTLVIYHNSVAGGEIDVLRKLRMNQIQAAVLSTYGLSSIAQDVMALSCPFLIRDNTELDLVLNAQTPELERQINARGYFTLAWSKVGWVKFFSKEPVFVPADLKAQKLGTDKDQPALTAAFKSMDYQMVPITVTEILMNLNTSMIDAVYQSPLSVAGLQIFGSAKNMASINVAPFMGAVVMNATAWRSIPDKYKPELVRIARKLETDMETAIQEFEVSIIDTMRAYGLIINQLTPVQEQLWYDDMTRIIPGLLGKTFSQTTYNSIDSILKKHRAGTKD
ncbi:hypothetical protein FACS1894190_06070 [Spirochaetia bacterium]|nr:hypothetical protein FACS1894190_06070 [Spirochaetia bacterium]